MQINLYVSTSNSIKKSHNHGISLFDHLTECERLDNSQGSSYPANTKRWSNAELLMCRHCRRRTSIHTALGQRLLLTV